jgi:hypothetical protein
MYLEKGVIMSGINNNLAAKSYFNRAQAIREIEQNASRAQKADRVYALSPKAKHLPAWVKPAGYTVLAVAAIAAMAFIGSRMTPSQTPTPNPNPNPNPAPLDSSTIPLDPKSTPDSHPKLDMNFLINLGDHYQNLDEVPDDDRKCSVTYKSSDSHGWSMNIGVSALGLVEMVNRKEIKQVIERIKEDYSKFDGRLEVKIDCDSEFAKSQIERFQQNQNGFIHSSKTIRV